MNISKRSGVFYYVCISSPRMNGWSSTFTFSARS